MAAIGSATATCSECGLSFEVPLTVREHKTLPARLGLTRTVKLKVTPDLSAVRDHVRNMHHYGYVHRN